MDISELNDWEQLMADDSLKSDDELYRKRRKIIENFKSEEALDKKVGQEVINCLKSKSEKYVKTCDAENISSSIFETQCELKDLMFIGNSIKHGGTEYFSFVRTADFMIRKLKRPQSSQKGSIFDEDEGETLESHDALLMKIKKELFPKEHWNVKIGNHLGFLWSIFESDLKQLINNGLDADDVRDMLGLDFEQYTKNNFLLYFTYTDPVAHHRPTIINGGDSAPFTPSDKGDSTGYTINLKDGTIGVPEIVRKKIQRLSNILTEYGKVGLLMKDPAKNYLKDYS